MDLKCPNCGVGLDVESELTLVLAEKPDDAVKAPAEGSRTDSSDGKAVDGSEAGGTA